MSLISQTDIDRLLADIVDDYYSFSEGFHHHYENLMNFANNIKVTNGKKYIKIVIEGSVWGFIVNTEDDNQFKLGDILKAASYKAPARNKARGNVLTSYDIQWTGPRYLK